MSAQRRERARRARRVTPPEPSAAGATSSTRAPARASAARVVAHATADAGTQASAARDVKGAGKEPTTAEPLPGPEPQSWWSHQITSPSFTRTCAGAAVRQDAVDVEEPVDRPPAAPPAGEPVDRCDEPAAVACRHLRVALHEADDRVGAADLGRVVAQDDGAAEVAGHEQARIRRRRAGTGAAGGETDGGERAQRTEDCSPPAHPLSARGTRRGSGHG